MTKYFTPGTFTRFWKALNRMLTGKMSGFMRLCRFYEKTRRYGGTPTTNEVNVSKICLP